MRFVAFLAFAIVPALAHADLTRLDQPTSPVLRQLKDALETKLGGPGMIPVIQSDTKEGARYITMRSIYWLRANESAFSIPGIYSVDEVKPGSKPLHAAIAHAVEMDYVHHYPTDALIAADQVLPDFEAALQANPKLQLLQGGDSSSWYECKWLTVTDYEASEQILLESCWTE